MKHHRTMVPEKLGADEYHYVVSLVVLFGRKYEVDVVFVRISVDGQK